LAVATRTVPADLGLKESVVTLMVTSTNDPAFTGRYTWTYSPWTFIIPPAEFLGGYPALAASIQTLDNEAAPASAKVYAQKAMHSNLYKCMKDGFPICLNAVIIFECTADKQNDNTGDVFGANDILAHGLLLFPDLPMEWIGNDNDRRVTARHIHPRTLERLQCAAKEAKHVADTGDAPRRPMGQGEYLTRVDLGCRWCESSKKNANPIEY